jgi:RNA polymerase sigma-70 factor (ECF subfamily)
MASCRSWLRHRARRRLSRGLERKVDSSDLVQDVQLLATTGLAKFKGQSFGEFRAWLAGILERRVLWVIRHLGRQLRDRNREEPLSPAWGTQLELAETGTSILERLSRQEESQRLNLAASWCREQDRALIGMHLGEGLSHEEIAARLGIAPATVRQRYSRAIRRVREALQLQAMMTQQGLNELQQDVIGLHRFQGAASEQIAERLRLPERLVAHWIAEAKPLLQSLAKDEP